MLLGACYALIQLYRSPATKTFPSALAILPRVESKLFVPSLKPDFLPFLFISIDGIPFHLNHLSQKWSHPYPVLYQVLLISPKEILSLIFAFHCGCHCFVRPSFLTLIIVLNSLLAFLLPTFLLRIPPLGQPLILSPACFLPFQGSLWSVGPRLPSSHMASCPQLPL